MKQGNGKTKIIINMGITIDMKSNQPSPRSKGKSLSAALKELKSEENWTPSVASAFAKVDISSPDELTPSKLLSLLTKNKKKDKNTGKVVIGVWAERKVKDFDGFYVRKFDGTYQTERVLRKVGSWTKNTLLRVLAQNGIVLDTQETGIMEESNADIIDINSSKQKLRDQRTYTEPAVKRILYSFARDLGCKWSKQKLEAFVETAFDFD